MLNGVLKLDNLYIILNRDVEDGYHIPISYEISKALKNYIYQVWILMLNERSNLLSPQQKNRSIITKIQK